MLLATAVNGDALGIDAARARSPSEQEYWVQHQQRDWDDAIASAEQLVEKSRLNANAAPLELADALSMLGGAQLANKNYIAAAAAYSEALQILEPRVVQTSERLLDPLRGLGFALAGGGKHDEAAPYLERALQVSRRTLGLFDLSQQSILRQLATSLVKTGQYVEADQQMQYLLRVGEHAYGKNDPRMAKVLASIGDFYMEAGLVGGAREAYRAALQIVEKKLGRNDLSTVQLLRAYADTFRRELFLSYYGVKALPERQTSLESSPPESKAINPRYLNTDGERALKRAIKTLDSQPTRPTALLFETLLDLGDWYMIKSQPSQALSYYKRAAGLIPQLDTDAAAAATAKLSFPAEVYSPVPMLATRNLTRPDDEVRERFVHVAFTVAADGSTRDETVVEQDASSRQVSETISAVRDARYRPKFVNGEPVDTPNVSKRQIFRQRKERSADSG